MSERGSKEFIIRRGSRTKHVGESGSSGRVLVSRRVLSERE